MKDRSIILGTSLLISSAVVLPTKHLVKEERPDGSNNLSFPSGHTAFAFATAQFMFQEYQDDNFWLSLTGYPFAVFTGIYRTLNDKHWVGDVVAGAGIGILSTEAAYWLFPKVSSLLVNKKTEHLVLMYPFYQDQLFGLGLNLQF
ncbi:phosphatase PAP2 family protein [Soonwooa buanensis]|uniref:phosphatase PAP2 family protein n=1 Tax=Soonwooa buanensis TaxID=619805 RepID=UPI0011819643|nr:phosphatase PAP2 family protein [Soonwooa buanensis]